MVTCSENMSHEGYETLGSPELTIQEVISTKIRQSGEGSPSHLQSPEGKKQVSDNWALGQWLSRGLQRPQQWEEIHSYYNGPRLMDIRTGYRCNAVMCKAEQVCFQGTSESWSWGLVSENQLLKPETMIMNKNSPFIHPFGYLHIYPFNNQPTLSSNIQDFY